MVVAMCGWGEAGGLANSFAWLHNGRMLLNKTLSVLTCGLCLFYSIPGKRKNWKKTPAVPQGHGQQLGGTGSLHGDRAWGGLRGVRNSTRGTSTTQWDLCPVSIQAYGKVATSCHSPATFT